jgi:hypothetical protein
MRTKGLTAYSQKDDKTNNELEKMKASKEKILRRGKIPRRIDPRKSKIDSNKKGNDK